MAIDIKAEEKNSANTQRLLEAALRSKSARYLNVSDGEVKLEAARRA